MTSGIDIEMFNIFCWNTAEVNLVAIKPTSLPDITIPATGRSSVSSSALKSSSSSAAKDPSSEDAASSAATSESPTASIQPASSTSIPSATSTTPTPTTTSTTPAESSNSGSRLNLAAIIAGVLGGLALICITIILVIYIVRNNRKETGNQAPMSKPNPSKPKRSFLTVSKRTTKDSDVSSEDTIILNDTQYPEPPDDKAHPEAGWGPSEAQGSEVQRYRGPWEMLNEDRPLEMSDHNRPAELPDYKFLETLPTIPQAPTRQDSWRPNDDGAAWGDVRPPPRLGDRLRYTATTRPVTYRHNPPNSADGWTPGDVNARQAFGHQRDDRTGMSANFAGPGWDRMDEDITTRVGDASKQSQRRVVGRSPSNMTSVSSHASIYTSSPARL
ncbi:hypothetical protein GQ607_017302 [Colletotrichum asianum]|uniref:Mid2 domain-containing protein n=1 Tax=Colletotrichum asianum TaxID=702518 RepID=A0A8H3VXD4_9PEZI|nr:hypothetical protein GQ607_017302 [Colletotrichum asianum]